jgi:tetratricopeptide (TPR) repeat protein
LARVALAEHKPDVARDTLIAILNRESRNVNALLNLAALEEQVARPMDAINYYERAVQEDPRNIPALNNLAYLLADTGKDPDRALALAQKVKELAPENPAIDDTVGWAYYNKGLFRISLEYLSKATAAGTPRRKCHLAMVYIKLGDRQRAVTILQGALKDDPSLPEAKKALQLLAQAR